MTHTVRPYKTEDLHRLVAINHSGEPGVSAVTDTSLEAIIVSGHCLVAENEQGLAVGFLLTLSPAANYASKNYQWIDQRYEDFLYVDRIAIASEARASGLGTLLYQHAFEVYKDKALIIMCEVNTIPPNPGSMRFHTRLGFKEVGAQTFSDEYAVAYLARRLA